MNVIIKCDLALAYLSFFFVPTKQNFIKKNIFNPCSKHLNLISAFDSADHNLLLSRLKKLCWSDGWSVLVLF